MRLRNCINCLPLWQCHCTTSVFDLMWLCGHRGAECELCFNSPVLYAPGKLHSSFVVLFLPQPTNGCRNSKEYQQTLPLHHRKQTSEETTVLFPGVHVSELANTIARSVFWWKPEITTLSPEPAQGSSKAAAVKSTLAEKKHKFLSLCLLVPLILSKRHISPLYLQRGWGAREEKIAFCGSINSDVYPAVWTSLWILPSAPFLSPLLSDFFTLTPRRVSNLF